MKTMASTALADHQATAEEVRTHADEIRDLTIGLDLKAPRLRDDGTVVVRSDEPGYRSVLRLSAAASEIVGAYVHVIADDACDDDALDVL